MVRSNDRKENMNLAPMIIHTGHYNRVPPEAVPYVAGVLIALIYLIIYMICLIAADKYNYKELSLFGKILFFPMGILPWVMKKIF